MCPPIYLSEIVFFVEYLQEKSSKLHFSAEFLILEKLKIVWKAFQSEVGLKQSTRQATYYYIINKSIESIK